MDLHLTSAAALPSLPEQKPARPLRRAEQVLLEAAGAFAGAVVHLRRGGEVLWHRAYGWAERQPRRRPMRPDMLFDLASLTKPLVTVTGILQQWEQGTLDLDGPVAGWIKDFGQAGKGGVTVRHLLSHTAGLAAWVRFYLRARTPDEAVAMICRTAPEAPPGAKVIYSDLGFMVLGALLERAGGVTLDRYLRTRIAPALRWERTTYRPPEAWREACAATEAGNAYERAMAAQAGEGEGFPWRTETIVGEAHDGNCHYLYAGVAPHAGLFSTAEEVGRFGQALLDGGQGPGGALLRPETIEEMTRDQSAASDGEGYGLGWRIRRGNPSLLPDPASPRAFGHTGFTGTSLVLDPARALVVVLLTNRVHPSAETPGFAPFRAAFHTAVLEALP